MSQNLQFSFNFDIFDVQSHYVGRGRLDFAIKTNFFATLQNFLFLTQGRVVLKVVFLNFSQNWEKISTYSFHQLITLLAHHQSLKVTMAPKRRRNEKSPKTPFSDPRKSQKIAISRHRAFLRQNASFTHRHNSPF